MKTTIQKKQLIAVIIIVFVTIVLAAIILKGNNSNKTSVMKPTDEHAAEKHGEDADHDKDSAVENGTIAMSAAQIESAKIVVLTAQPASIESLLTLPGAIRLNDDRTAHVVPRLAGVVQNVHVQLGQQVKKGQVLAEIASTVLAQQRSDLRTAQTRLGIATRSFEREQKLWQEQISAEQDYLEAQQALQEAQIAVQNASSQLLALGAGVGAKGYGNLNALELRAPFDGVIVEKHITLGEAIKEDAMVFTVSDLGSVWAEIAVPAKDIAAIRVGQKVRVKTSDFAASATGTVAYVGSLIGEQTRTATARVTLKNPSGEWRPGLAIAVEVEAGAVDAAVTVVPDAVHSVDGKSVVFRQVTGGFYTQAVQIGRSDHRSVEIISGLAPGTPYAATGSFVVKSELGKASAEHAH